MNCTLKECPMFDALLTGTHLCDDPANCCIVYGDPVNCRLLKLFHKQVSPRELLILFAKFIQNEYWDNTGIEDSVDTFIKTKLFERNL